MFNGSTPTTGLMLCHRRKQHTECVFFGTLCHVLYVGILRLHYGDIAFKICGGHTGHIEITLCEYATPEMVQWCLWQSMEWILV